MASYKAVQCVDTSEKASSSEVNHNERWYSETSVQTRAERLLPRQDTNLLRGLTSEVIELPNDGRVEIVASRRFGKRVISSRDKDEVAITFDHDDAIRIHIAARQKSRVQNALQNCGAHIPHGPAVLDIFVSSIMFVYASVLALLVAYVRREWKYLSILLLWFFYIILRVNSFNTLGASISTLKRKIWHFTGISFGIVFMYFTLVIVFPMLTRDAYYEQPTTTSDDRPSILLIMSTLKASVAFALLGMASRRSFHCGKIISHMDIINSLLLGNVDIFNLVEALSLKDGVLPVIPKGSAMEISILVACEVAFLIIALEALMPYSLITLDKQNVGKVRQDVSLKRTKEQAIVMVYPYSLLVQNVPFLVIRVLLFACYDSLQLAYMIKNVTSIVLGAITLIRARSNLMKKENDAAEFLGTALTHRRVSV
ncbi:uncharacterized protein LOC114517737 [Dendronephthya gigantea]|uniref:uncharacterized protein LOC114517737 n=1 Tax=Dendronephthya gigantea TaxID=151771 RepID=UPI00106CAFA7|nr:uncharacterized protein LOC114517737 [Dendronephthya gigantea]